MTIGQIKSNLQNYKLGYISTAEFILEHYKDSTLPRMMFHDFKMSIESINSNEKIREHILNDGLDCGFAQDDLFMAMWI